MNTEAESQLLDQRMWKTGTDMGPDAPDHAPEPHNQNVIYSFSGYLSREDGV